MRQFAIAVVASLTAILPLAAQTNPPAPAPSITPVPNSSAPAAATPTPATPAPEMTKDGKPKAKDVRAECRETAKSQGLKGDDRRKAVSECFIKARPDLAVKEQCHMDGYAKGLRKDELKAFVKDCKKNKG